MKKMPVTQKTALLLSRVRDILESARVNLARTVNTTQVVANWLIGREIVEEEQRGKKRADYGQQLVAQLSIALTEVYGKGWSAQNLFYMRQFYLTYPHLLEAEKNLHSVGGELARPQILHSVRGESVAWQPGLLNSSLSWTHYRTLLKVGRAEARAFYEIEAVENNWSVRELDRQISSLLFDRLAKSRNKKNLMRLAQKGQEVQKPIDVLKDPMVLEFLDLPDSPHFVESKLEQALIGNLETFLLELGKGFAFLSRQERITLDGDHFYIDLVFYHTILKCFVLIDLKVGKLSHADLGQIQFYVNYFDRERRTKGDNPTIGLILCPDKNDAVVKYTLGEQLKRNIFTSRYQMYLPTEQELQNELQREMRFLDISESKPSIKITKQKAVKSKVDNKELSNKKERKKP